MPVGKEMERVDEVVAILVEFLLRVEIVEVGVSNVPADLSFDVVLLGEVPARPEALCDVAVEFFKPVPVMRGLVECVKLVSEVRSDDRQVVLLVVVILVGISNTLLLDITFPIPGIVIVARVELPNGRDAENVNVRLWVVIFVAKWFGGIVTVWYIVRITVPAQLVVGTTVCFVLFVDFVADLFI